MLKADPVVTPVIKEALEGYATGRFETQMAVTDWLNAHPLFPKGKCPATHATRVHGILRQPLYAG